MYLQNLVVFTGQTELQMIRRIPCLLIYERWSLYILYCVNLLSQLIFFFKNDSFYLSTDSSYLQQWTLSLGGLPGAFPALSLFPSSPPLRAFWRLFFPSPSFLLSAYPVPNTLCCRFPVTTRLLRIFVTVSEW